MYIKLFLLVALLSTIYQYFNSKTIQGEYLHDIDEKVHPILFKKKDQKLNVGIIGGGIAGSSNAYFLNKFLDKDVEITLYEKQREFGGRTKSHYMADGTRLDIGGTSIIMENRYGVEFTKMCKVSFAPKLNTERLVLWDEEKKKIVFQESENQGLTIANVLLKYHLKMFSAKREVNLMLQKFLKVYHLQDKLETFNSLKEFMDKIGLYSYTQTTFDKFIQQNSLFGQQFWRDFLVPILRVNYNQNSQATAFVSMVSSAAIVSDFETLDQGTDSLSRCLVSQAKPNVKMNSTITRIEKRELDYLVTYKEFGSEGCKEYTSNHDIIVLGVPIELSNIEFINIKIPTYKREYVKVHTTFVTGNLNLKRFNLEPSQSIVYSVITTGENETNFYSIALTDFTKSGDTIYKIFSKNEVTESELYDYFSEFKWVHRDWFYAYPKYYNLTTEKDWHDIEFDTNIYEINSMESIVSTIETEIISSKNIALLITKKFYQ